MKRIQIRRELSQTVDELRGCTMAQYKIDKDLESKNKFMDLQNDRNSSSLKMIKYKGVSPTPLFIFYLTINIMSTRHLLQLLGDR